MVKLHIMSHGFDREVYVDGVGFAIPDRRTHRIEPGVFLDVSAMGMRQREAPPYPPTDTDYLEEELDALYYGARRSPLAAPSFRGTSTPAGVVRIVEPEVAAQEEAMWGGRDREARLLEVSGQIQAEQHLGRGLTPEEPLWPVGLFFDWNQHFGNAPPSIGRKMQRAGMPLQDRLGPFDNRVAKQAAGRRGR